MSKKDYRLYEHYSWQELENDIQQLSKIIKKEFDPEVVICISTGGWIPGRLLKNHISANYYSIGCVAYNEDGNYSGNINIMHDINYNLIKGKDILVLDEVCETGRTLSYVVEYLSKQSPNSIFTAVIHLKNKAYFKPRFFVHQVEDKWIIYPWSKV